MVTRVEVYGLFLATVVIGGGSAYAITSDTPTEAAPVVVSSTPMPTPVQTTEPVADVVAEQQVQSGSPDPAVVEDHTPAQFMLLGPWIGPAETLAQDSKDYTCAWAYDGFGGRGYGYGPDAMCNNEYLNYIAMNCGTRDENGQWTGIVYRQLCDEWESHTLRIEY